jgi:hypothetical protein
MAAAWPPHGRQALALDVSHNAFDDTAPTCDRVALEDGRGDGTAPRRTRASRHKTRRMLARHLGGHGGAIARLP